MTLTTTKEKVKHLWKLCFNDDDEFIDLYFGKRYKDEINMAIIEDDKAIAALQMIPYPMTACGNTVHTAYISGACTHPDYRNKGIMAKLLRQTLNRMYDDQALLSSLIPAEEWLIDYYRRFGYEPVFNYSVKTTEIATLTPSDKYTVCVFQGNPQDIYPYFNTRMEECSCCVQHPIDDFLLIVEDIHLGGGELLVAYDDNQEMVGIAFCYPSKEGFLIKELFNENPEIEDALLLKAASLTGQTNIDQYIPPVGGDSNHLGMARIVSAKDMLKQYSFKHDSLTINIKLSDEILKQNEGYYHINNNIVRKTDKPEAGILYQDMTINDLAKSMMEFRPYMSLMMD